MEKEVKIQIPEGYEIDCEKSSFERIVFKKKGLTYKDVMKALLSYKNGYFIDSQGTILGSNYCPENTAEPNAATNRRQLEQILALNKLMNVAQYLNEVPLNWGDKHQCKWYIYYDHTRNGFRFATHYVLSWAPVYFDSEEHAKQAIEILGETEVKKAFGIFE